MNNKEKSGWEDEIEDKPTKWETVYKQCHHREHEPPNMMAIPPGKVYRHVCPGCGHTVRIHSSNIRF